MKRVELRWNGRNERTKRSVGASISRTRNPLPLLSCSARLYSSWSIWTASGCRGSVLRRLLTASSPAASARQNIAMSSKRPRDASVSDNVDIKSPPNDENAEASSANQESPSSNSKRDQAPKRQRLHDDEDDDGDDDDARRRQANETGADGGDDDDDLMMQRAFRRNDAKATRIKLLTVKVGQNALKEESAQKLADQLRMLAKAFEPDFQDYGDVNVAALVEAGGSFGWKAPVYGTLAGLLPTSLQMDAARCAEKRLLKCIRGQTQFHSQAGVVLRLLCEMCNANVVALEPLVKTMDVLLENGLAWIVVRALPWLKFARGDSDVRKQSVNEIVSKLDAMSDDAAPGWKEAKLLLEPGNLEGAHLIRPYENDDVQKVLSHARSEDAPCMLETLTEKLEEVIKANMEDKSIPEQLNLRLFDVAGEKVVEHQAKHMQDGKILDMEQEEAKSGLQLAREMTIESLPPQVRWIMRQYVEEVLHAYYPHVDEAVEGLLEFGDGRKYDHFMFESALNVLAQGTGNAMFIKRILIELTKMKFGSRKRKRFAVVAEDAVDAIMVLLPSLPATAVDAFAEWFSFHLSTVSPQWPYGKWDHLADAEDRDINPRCLFLRRVLELHANMSLRDNLLETVTAPLRQHLLVGERRPKSRFLPETGAPSLEGLGAADVADFVRQKPEEDEFRQWFNGKAERLSVADRAECLLHGVLLAGQATFTHTTRALERVLPVVKEIIEASGVQPLEIAAMAHSFWGTCTQWSAFVLYSLVRLQVLTAEELGAYCLTKVAKDRYTEWMFHLLQGLLDSRKQETAALMGLMRSTQEQMKNAESETLPPGNLERLQHLIEVNSEEDKL